jgi:hypothetical protein
MQRGPALQSCFTVDRAFGDGDRTHRVAAIHHALEQMRTDAGLRERVRTLLDDADLFVASYAAVTLARAGDYAGVRYLLRQLYEGEEASQPLFRRCLRDCTTFPFVALLAETLDLRDLGSLQPRAAGAALELVLQSTHQQVNGALADVPGLKEQLQGAFAGSAAFEGAGRREGRVLGSGKVTGVPRVMFIPGKGRTLVDGKIKTTEAPRIAWRFGEEVVLNPDTLRQGVEALFAGEEGERLGMVYIFEV